MTAPPSTQPGRPLPSTARGRRTRALIVDAAAELFYAQGVAATSLDAVIERSGVGKSQLYHYFADRQDLVRAVVDRQLERVLGGQPRLATVETWADLSAWADDLVALHRGPGGPLACPVGSLAAEIDRDEALRASAAASFRAWADALQRAIERLQASGEARGDVDAGRLALRLLAGLQGGLLVAHTLGDPAIVADALERLLRDLRAPAAVG